MSEEYLESLERIEAARVHALKRKYTLYADTFDIAKQEVGKQAAEIAALKKRVEELEVKTLDAFQGRTSDWVRECFSSRICTARKERSFRFLEEALELVQALELTADDARLVVDYVYGRPAGDPSQEVGGVMVTLAALCWNERMFLQSAAFTELERIEQPEIMDKIRAKQDAKSAAGVGRSSKTPSQGGE